MAEPNTSPAPAPISLGTLLQAVQRYSLVMAAFVLLAAAVGAGVWMFLPLPKHTGHVVFQILATQPYNLSPIADQHSDFNLYRQFQVTSVKSNNVLTLALADPALANTEWLDKNKHPNPVTDLSKSLRVDFTLGPEFMRLVLEGDVPDQITATLKAITNVYLKEVVNKDKTRRSAKLEQLRKLYESYLDQLRLSRTRMREIMKVVGSSDPYTLQVRERFIESQIGMAQTQLASLIASQRDDAVSNKVLNTTTAVPDTLPDAILADLAKNDPSFLLLQKKEQELNQQIEELSRYLAPGVKSPKVLELENQLQQVKKQREDLPNKLKPILAARYQETIAKDNQTKAENLKTRMTLLKEMEKAVAADIEELLNKKREIANGQFELEGLKQEMAYTEKIAEKIATDIEAIKPELDAPNRVSLWEDVVISPGVEGNRRLKYSLGAAAGVLFLGLGFVQWLDLRNRRVINPDELTRRLGLTLMGVLPRIRRTGPNGRVEATHQLAEAINTTRTMLLTGHSSKVRTLLVTSANSGEGKTSLATHLAVSLASTGRRILLIDADMRRPTVHLVLGVPPAPGLSESLVAATEDTRTLPIVSSRVKGLNVLAAGKWDAAAAASLTGPYLDRILSDALQHYDIVIVDSPPILPVADALAIAKKVDGVLMSVMQDESRYGAVETAFNRLKQVGANVLGVVVAGVPVKNSQYYYYYDPRYTSTPKSAVDSTSSRQARLPV